MAEKEEKQTVYKNKLLLDVNERLKELDELQEVEDMIQHNTIEFHFNDKTYRVRKPGRKEKYEIRAMKNKKANELIRDPENVTEEELIQLHLSRNNPVDIQKLRQKVIGFQRKIEQLAIRIIETPVKSDREKLTKEAESLKHDQLAVQYRLHDLLSSCIEQQLKEFLQEYIVYSVLEEKHGDSWKRYFKTYDQFMDSNDDNEDKLIYRATYFLTVLLNRDV